MMQILTIQIPETAEVDQQQIAMIVACKLFEQGKLTLGQAAKVAGLDKRTFMHQLGSQGVSIFNYPPEDLQSDVMNA